MIDESEGVRPDNGEIWREFASGLFADPDQLVREISADTFLCDVAGVVPKTASVEIAEYDLLLCRKQIAELPGPPDEGFVQLGVDFG